MQDDDEANMFMTVPCEEECEEEFIVNSVVNEQSTLSLTKVLLDNQADISIVHPCLLTNIHQAKKQIKVRGVSGLQLTVDHVGMLEGFFQIHTSEHTKVNALSFVEVEDLYSIT
jgi:hypothetical protein